MRHPISTGKHRRKSTPRFSARQVLLRLPLPKKRASIFRVLFYIRLKVEFHRRSFLLVVILPIALLLVPGLITLPDFPKHSPPAGVEVRPCKIAAATATSRKETSRNKQKNVQDAPEAATNACLEVHSTSLDIQEYLQAYAREQKWKIADERVSEDTWTFVRNLESKDLLSATKSNPSNSRITWTSGKALVKLWTEELEGGFTRVSISAGFVGYGQNADQFAPQRQSWPLDSNGTLESQLISALETHFRSLHQNLNCGLAHSAPSAAVRPAGDRRNPVFPLSRMDTSGGTQRKKYFSCVNLEQPGRRVVASNSLNGGIGALHRTRCEGCLSSRSPFLSGSGFFLHYFCLSVSRRCSRDGADFAGAPVESAPISNRHDAMRELPPVRSEHSHV